MENKSQWIGIDISKSMLDVYIRPLNKAQRYSNDAEGIAKLVTQLEELSIELITLEATGGLERLVIEQLQTANLPAAMINHRQGRDFAKATGKLAKTDAIDRIDSELEELTLAEREWSNKFNLVKSVPGIGKVIANTLVADLPELGRLSAKQIARLVGVAPINFDSGQYRGKRRIAGGRAHIRSVLYMGALVAMRHNPAIKSFYTRLVERGKSPKLALTACVRKLLVILNAMVRDSRPWHLECEFVTNPS